MGPMAKRTKMTPVRETVDGIGHLARVLKPMKKLKTYYLVFDGEAIQAKGGGKGFRLFVLPNGEQQDGKHGWPY